MKKVLLFSFMALMIGAFSSCKKETKVIEEEKKEEKKEEEEKEKEKFLASETPEKRSVLLEDFTGVRCGFCPDGHVRAKALADANPGKVVILSVHAGIYAIPAEGWANFTTTAGTAINNQAAPRGYPAGTINRIIFEDILQYSVSQQTGDTTYAKIALNRGSWATAAGRVFPMDAPVNIGAKATYDAATRKLTVKVDMFYTGDQSGADNRLNVALVQDHIFSRQSGAPNPNNYEQNHVLRDFLTGIWGEPITESKTVGSKITKTYTYDVPEDYNGAAIPPGGGAVVIDDLKVTIFVTEGQTEVLNVIEVDVE